MSKLLSAIRSKVDDLVTVESATLLTKEGQTSTVVGYCRTELEGDHVAFLPKDEGDINLTEFHIKITLEAHKSRTVMLKLISGIIKQL